MATVYGPDWSAYRAQSDTSATAGETFADRRLAPDQESYFPAWAPAAARIVPPLVGNILGAPGGPAGIAALGFVGGGVGEYAAQLIEQSRGTREDINPSTIAAAAGISGIPYGRTSTVLGTVGREALTGTGAVSIHPVLEEGRLPTAGELAVGAGLGAGAGVLVRRGNIKQAKREAEAEAYATGRKARLAEHSSALDAKIKDVLARRLPTSLSEQREQLVRDADEIDALLRAQSQASADAGLGKTYSGTIRQGAIGRMLTGRRQQREWPAHADWQEGEGFVTKSVNPRETPSPAGTVGPGDIVRESYRDIVTGAARRPMDPLATPTGEAAVEVGVNMARKHLGVLADRAAKSDQRLFRDVADLIETKTITDADLLETLSRHGLGLDEFLLSKELRAEASKAGRVLQRFSLLRKELDTIVGEYKTGVRTGTADGFEFLQKAADTANAPADLWGWFLHGGSWAQMPFMRATPRLGAGVDQILPAWKGYVALDEVRRKLLVAQLKTTTRNILTQIPRYMIGALDEGLQRTLGSWRTEGGNIFSPMRMGRAVGAGMADSIGMLAYGFSLLRPQKRKEMISFLDNVYEEFDDAALKLFRQPIGEAAAGKGWADKMNFLNRGQEDFFRKATFHGILTNGLRRRGIALQDAVERPYLIPGDLVDEAVEKSLQNTFAATPTGAPGRMVMKLFQDLPLLTIAVPFPRFMANAYSFLLNFNPLGVARLAKIDPADVGKADKQNEILSQAAIGTTLWASAWGLDAAGYVGEKWFQIKDADKLYDVRGYAPLATPMFYQRVIKGLVNVWNEDDYRRAQAGEFYPDQGNMDRALASVGMTWKDMIVGALQVNRLTGPGARMLQADTEAGFTRFLGELVGEYFGGFTVPWRTVKDFYAGTVDMEQVAARDLRTRSVAQGIGWRTAQNIPGLAVVAPKLASPTQAAVRSGERPIWSQLTGLNVFTQTPLEQELDRLRVPRSVIYSRQSNPEARGLVTAAQGAMLERLGPELMASPGYRELSGPFKRLLWESLIAKIKGAALRHTKQEHPDLAVELLIEQQPGKIKRLYKGDLPADPQEDLLPLLGVLD